jgi:hypothetical protein
MGLSDFCQTIMPTDHKIINKSLEREEMAYFLLMDRESLAYKQVRYPLAGVFIIEARKSPKNTPIPEDVRHRVPLCFSLNARTARNIVGKISQLIPEMSREKAFLFDKNLPLTPKNRTTLYHLLRRTFKYIYFLDPLLEGRHESVEFTEIFPDESMITLFEKVPELRDIPWDEPIKNNRVSPDFHTLKK